MFKRILLTFIPLLIVSSVVYGEENESLNRAATKTVKVQIGLQTLEKAMLDALERHPTTDRWSGVTENQIFGIVVVPFTERDVTDGDLGMLRKTAQLLAMKELLLAKVLLDRFAESGLTDSSTLRQAVAEANESLLIHTKIDFSIKETYLDDKWIVGIVVADREKIVTTVSSRTQTEAVREAYRQLVRQNATTLIQKRKFEQALLRFRELRLAGLYDEECLTDVLRCFVGLDRVDDANKIVESLLAKNSENVELYRHVVEILADSPNVKFQHLMDQLWKEIDRLDPPETTMEETLSQLLNENSK